ncbi:MAG: sulfotransferase [Pirellulaceae bacterium]|nr:sulfotransferase [Pirellulaceae bacterium]
MKFISITGFPRTGTTWLLRALLNSPDCSGVPAELGFPRIWWTNTVMRRDWPGNPIDLGWKRVATLNPLKAKNAASIIAWPGLYCANWLKRIGPTRLLDAIANEVRDLDKPAFVEKTPCDLWVPDWPAAYVEKSRLFDDHRLIVCRRDFGDIWKSAARKYDHWLSTMDRDDYQGQYDRYYEAAEGFDACLMDHGRVSKDPVAQFERACEYCDISPGEVPEWKVTT